MCPLFIPAILVPVMVLIFFSELAPINKTTFILYSPTGLSKILIILSFWLFQFIILQNKIEIGRTFHFLNFILLLTLWVCFSTSRILIFYISFEFTLVPTFFMIWYYGYQPEKLQACVYFIIYTVITSLPLLIFIITSHDSLSIFTNDLRNFKKEFVVAILTIAFIVKTPIFLVHIWLPKAHVEAPVAGSILLAGILLKLGSYGLFLFLPNITVTKTLMVYLFIRMVGALISSFICFRQSDIKALIAYSSVVHITIVTVGLVRQLKIGYSAATIIVIAHGVCRPSIFALASNLYRNSHTRLMVINKGNVSTPLVILISIIIIRANIGVPPSINLWSEVIAITSLISLFVWRLILFIPIALLAVLYNLFLYVSLIHGKNIKRKNLLVLNQNFSIISRIFWCYFLTLGIFFF